MLIPARGPLQLVVVGVASRLVRLAERLRAEIQKFDSFEIVWVDRRNNKTADLLSKVGLSKADLALESAG